MNKIILPLVLFCTSFSSAIAQTCSCAGAPLLSAQFVGAGKAGQLVIGLTYEHHEISRVFTGSQEVGQETKRATRSTLLEVHYGITDRISLSSTINFAQKDRTTGIGTTVQGTTVSTSGIGDALFMVTYTIVKQSLWQKHLLLVSAGAKAPFGSSSLERNGHPLNADMQPGTGAWDGVALVYWSYSMLPRSKVTLFASANYRYSGSNERFNSADNYTFGNGLTVSAGGGNSISTRFSYALAMIYRTTTQDALNKADIFNTGGRWLSVAPALQYTLSTQTDVRLAGRLPVAQSLQGTQPSTTFAVSISFFYKFGLGKSGFTKR